MATSLNGWVAIPNSTDYRLAWGLIPGTKHRILCRKEALPVFLAFLADVNKKVIPLDPGPVDGWEYRQAHAANGLSDHSSGTAVDFRYDVLKADEQTHMTLAQHAEMHKLMDKYVTSKGKRIFGWGGDWTPGKYEDEMHVELIQYWSPGAQNADCTLADVENVIKRLGIKPDGTISLIHKITKPLKPAPVPPAKPVVSLRNVQPGLTNAQVKIVQGALKRFVNPKFVPTGKFDAATKTTYSAWQKSLGYSGAAADGVPGIASLTKLGAKAGFIAKP